MPRWLFGRFWFWFWAQAIHLLRPCHPPLGFWAHPPLADCLNRQPSVSGAWVLQSGRALMRRFPHFNPPNNNRPPRLWNALEMLFPSAFSFILLQVVFVALVVSVTERFLCSDMQFVLYAHCLHRLSVPLPPFPWRVKTPWKPAPMPLPLSLSNCLAAYRAPSICLSFLSLYNLHEAIDHGGILVRRSIIITWKCKKYIFLIQTLRYEL